MGRFRLLVLILGNRLLRIHMKLVSREPEYLHYLKGDAPELWESFHGVLNVGENELQLSMATNKSILHTFLEDDGKLAGLCLLQVHEEGFRRSLYVTAYAGNLAGKQLLLRNELEKVMHSWNCEDITFYGRPGFAKVLSSIQFKTRKVEMVWKPE